jgi:hypothetical protein
MGVSSRVLDKLLDPHFIDGSLAHLTSGGHYKGDGYSV